MKPVLPIAFALLAGVACTGALGAAPSDLARAETLVREGKAQEAYRLLQPLEFERAGNVDFDYLLGVAALEAGLPDRATLAFERVLAVAPDFAGARLDMARAYFALGDLERARADFQTVLSQDPPPGARATVERYLAAIDARTSAKRTRYSAFVEGTLGRDTNVGNSTAQSQVFLPVFGVNATLSASSLKTADNYVAGAAGGEVAHSVGDGIDLFAGAEARARVNQRADTFDFSTIDVRAGAALTRDRNILRAGLGYQQYTLDNTRNRETSSVFADLRHNRDARNQFAVYSQYSQVRYPSPTLVANSVNQTLLGAGWVHAYDDSGRTNVFGTIFAGRENDTDGRTDGAKGLRGFRLAGQVPVSGSVDLYASLGAQVGDYEAQNIVFQTYRRDRQYDATAGATWRLARDLTLRPQIAYVRNHSNVPIYDYDRYDVSVTLRRDFR